MTLPVSFKNLPYITYGTTRLGDGSIPAEDRVKLTLELMKTGLWFHTSHQYGDAETILGQAFKQAPDNIPKLMIKMGGGSIEELRADIKKNIEPMGVAGVEVGQLCLGDGPLAEELAAGGAFYEGLEQIKKDGLVKHYVLEVFPWTSAPALKALQSGGLQGKVEALIFYFNPLQRFVSNDLWNLMKETDFPWLALRTVGGGDVEHLAADPKNAWMEYLHHRSVQILPIFKRSGIKTWAEFCVRFATSFRNIPGTITASSKMERVEHLMDCEKRREPLPKDILDEIDGLQTKWANEVDAKADPWTM